jgi:hypothetical protein
MTRTRRWATILAVATLAALPAAAVAVTFGTPMDVPTNGVPAGHELRLGAAADGTVVAGWPDHQPGPLQVKAAVRPPGGDFGTAQKLSPDGVYGELLYLGVGAQGHALAVWTEDGVTAEPRYATRAPGGDFGPAADLPVPPGYAGAARFDVGANGVAAAIYPTYDTSGDDEIVTSVRDPATGSWGAFQQLAGAPHSSFPRVHLCGVKFAPSGDLLALYESMGDTAFHVRSKYRPAGGAWGNEQSFPAGSGCQYMSDPDRGLDVDASGRFALLWFNELDSLGAIRGPGQAGVWTSTVIAPGEQSAGLTSSLAADDAGNVVIALDLDGILVARYSASSMTWDTSARFARTPAVTLQDPRVGADRDSGAFVVAMRRRENAEDKVYATGADGPGAAFGPLTRLGPANQLFTVSAIPASGGTWAIGFEEYDGSQPDDSNRLKVVVPGTATVAPPPPGPGDPAPTGGGTTPSGGSSPGPEASTAGALPKFATLVKLPSGKRCVKRKASLRIRFRVPAGLPVGDAVITVNGKRFKVIGAAALSKPVGLPKRARRVTVTLRLADGRQITGKRTYRRCPRRKG